MRRMTSGLIFAPTMAVAHPGDHNLGGFLPSLTHAVSQPDHILIALISAALGYGVFRWARSQS